MICFLSYARRDKNPYLSSFLADLTATIAARSGIERPLFVDEEGIGNGADWPSTLAEALSKCPVFAYLHSPSYFTRPDCGREWGVFRQRMEAANAIARDAYKLSPMIPIHWISTEHAFVQLPQEVEGVQFTLPGMDTRYQKDGMQSLAKFRNDPSYDRCVVSLAKHILQCAKEVGLAPTDRIAPYATIAPAFPVERTALSKINETWSAPRSTWGSAGPRRARFIFVAAPPNELRNVRENLAAYEPSGEDMWKPFYTKAPDEEAVRIAQDACVNTKLIFETATIVKDVKLLREHLNEARRNGMPVIIFIDVWTLRLEAYQNALKDLDEMPPSNCVPFMPWDLDDRETLDAQTTLHRVVQDTFPWLLSGKYKSNFDSITSVEDLRNRVETSLTEIKNILIRRLTPTTNLVGPQTSMPILPSPTIKY